MTGRDIALLVGVVIIFGLGATYANSLKTRVAINISIIVATLATVFAYWYLT